MGQAVASALAREQQSIESLQQQPKTALGIIFHIILSNLRLQSSRNLYKQRTPASL
ncbi:hypothetical protein PCASD_23393 [Puccinia coronata f. sp. avenae]|uniref:Uncharacterized protein n=1 Tax=Puccinia coronata f. sp. avenae TaxID=200324 RepID=A0A2N5SKC4_9BASI|nr:hypothetical protein PCASD_23393 [Puccinia coronata f. sp. avenae]